MYLFRALNSLDMEIDPLKNGIASKQLIYNATKRHLYRTQKELMDQLPKKDKDAYIKEYMPTYIKNHMHKLFKTFEKDHTPVKNAINNFYHDKDIFSYYKMIKDVSSLPNHLINGSRTYTNWISTTKEFNNVWDYYYRQDTHSIAVLDLYTNGLCNEDTYVVDVSNKETIDRIKFISNRIDDNDYEYFINLAKENPALREEMKNLFHKHIISPTNKRFMGFNFSSASGECSIYEYISKKDIISILEPLEIDFLCAEMFNENFIVLPIKEQMAELKKLKAKILKHIIEDNDPYMLRVFEELYLNNNNIVATDLYKDNKEKTLEVRNLILCKSRKLASPIIKKSDI